MDEIPDCICGHDIEAHYHPDGDEIAGCKLCDCHEWREIEQPEE